ncbi:MAG: hybrid sensor histidine kinase/response regulator [Betaproteobacteria bacterium]
MASVEFAPSVLAHARADQIASLYGSWHRTTVSMVLGASILCGVLWDQEIGWTMAMWFAAILANQAWRGVLTRAYLRAQPPVRDAWRWGAYWAVGSTLAGGLWGAAAIAMFPASPAYQALFIVCQFSVILGGLSLTAVYRPSFHGFVLAALIPLIVRVALEGGRAHLFTALVLVVVLGFVLAFGRQVNDVLTQSLAMRYENLDLIGELKAQTEAALAARTAAETANRAKSQFLAAASHDLRQPLHAMGLFAAALAARAHDPDVKPLVASIRASVEALEALFGQLFDLSQLEAGALHPAPEAFALDPLLTRVAADLAPQAMANGLALRAVHTRLAVRTDPVLLERILRNFVTNAVRYTRQGGIVLGARRSADTVRIDVIDTGEGIADADRARVFDEFVQLKATSRHPAGERGMGLGLSIVRRLAQLLDHRIDLDSAPGRGSRFSIAVPRTTLPRRRRDAHPARSPAPAIAARALAGRTVVVVDDDPAVVAAMRSLFASWKACAVGGADADATLATLAATPGASYGKVDLIIADLRLADGASGIDAIAKLRCTLGNDTPALIVSGDTSGAAQAEVDAAQIRLLFKPVVATALKEAAEAALDVCGDPSATRTKQRVAQPVSR